MNDQIQTIELERDGRRFSALAQGEGPLALCIHGFPDHHRSYRFQLPALAEAGYRAVAPMLRGYEASSQGPKHVPDYHPLASAQDAIYFAKRLGGGRPVDLIGHDWGGIISELMVALEPELFRTVTAIAAPPMHAMSAGVRAVPSQLLNSWYAMFFQLRGLSDAVVRARDFAFIEKLWRDWSPGWVWEAEDMSSLKHTFAQPGVLWCALAYYRAMVNSRLDVSRDARALSEQPVQVPTLLISGVLDGCMDTRIYDSVEASHYAAGWRLERIAGAGHFVHQEKPQEVNALLLEWMHRDG